uniref:Uncharacterized protein n=1 Tax=Cupriavidus taiwanensis TaxID=164546 RepID=A0A375HD42_9BURK|nr:protein of unknown function [Cupriavidus taiwanensis]
MKITKCHIISLYSDHKFTLHYGNI